MSKISGFFHPFSSKLLAVCNVTSLIFRLTISENAGIERSRLSSSSSSSVLSTSEKPVNLEDLISGHVQVQTELCSQTRNNIDSVAGRRADERSQITSTYAETVGKLIHIIGDLERLTSGI